MLVTVASAFMAFAFVLVPPTTGTPSAAAPALSAPSASPANSAGNAPTTGTGSSTPYSATPILPASVCSSLPSTRDDASYAGFVNPVDQLAYGLPATGLSAATLPYARPIADQTVNGVARVGRAAS